MSSYTNNDKNSLNTTQQMQKKQQQENPNYQQQAQQKVPLTSEDTTIIKSISTVEMQCLKRVFTLLCSQTTLQEYQQFQTTKFSDKSVYSQNNSRNIGGNTNNFNNQDQIKEFFTWKDLMSVLNELEYEITKPEVEEIIWEVNESLNGKIDWYEFELMYKRKTLNSDFWIEPSELFYIVEFLMFLQKYVESVQHQEQNNKTLNRNDSDYENEEDIQNTIQEEDDEEQEGLNQTMGEQDQNLNKTGNQKILKRPKKAFNGFGNKKGKNHLNKVFFEKTEIGYDSALELLFIRYGKEKVTDLIWEIFQVDMDNSKDSSNTQQGTERYDKTINLLKYLEIMRKREFKYQKKLEKENVKYYNTVLLNQEQKKRKEKEEKNAKRH